MATQAEVIGNSIAASALANAALAMLVRIGQADLLEDVKSTALTTLNNSISAADNGAFDKDAALDAGRIWLFGQIVAAKLSAAAPVPPRTAKHQ